MAKNSINVKATNAMKQIEMNVNLTHVKRLKIKVKIGVLLIKLACWIIGCSYIITTEEETK